MNSRIGPTIANLNLVVKSSSMGGAREMITSMKDLLAMIIYLVSCVGVNRLPWLDGVVNTQKVWQDG